MDEGLGVWGSSCMDGGADCGCNRPGAGHTLVANAWKRFTRAARDSSTVYCVQ